MRMPDRVRRLTDWRAFGADAVAILGWFVVAGLVGGVLWWQLTPLAEWTRTTGNAEMPEVELRRMVAIDGWFMLVAALGGLVSGLVLAVWRKRDPISTVLLIVVGAGLASASMAVTGHLLGPGDLKEALSSAATGAKVPVELRPASHGTYLVWPVTALFGALLVLWGTTPSRKDADDEAIPQPTG